MHSLAFSGWRAGVRRWGGFLLAAALAASAGFSQDLPRIENLVRLSPAVARPGDVVRFRVDLHSGSGTSHDVRLVVSDPTWTGFWVEPVFVTLPPGTRTSVSFAIPIPPTFLDGTYRVTDTYLVDEREQSSHYARDGKSWSRWGSNYRESVHALPLAQADFVVEGGIPGYESPRILSVSRESPGVLAPGGTLILAARVAWGNTGVGRVMAILDGPDQQQRAVALEDHGGGVWKSRETIDARWLDGGYSLFLVSIADPSGRGQIYERSGVLRLPGPGVGRFESHALDLSPLDFLVSGGLTQPVDCRLVSIRRVSGPPYAPAQPVALQAVVSPGGSTLRRVGVDYINAAGVRWTLPIPERPANADGTVSLEGHFPRLLQEGPHAAAAVVVISSSGVSLHYERSGKVFRNNVELNGRHTFDLSALDFVATALPIAPLIAEFPSGLRYVARGSQVRLAATATGSEPLTYQWLRDGVAIPGATSPTLQIAAVQPTDTGSYHLVVTGPGGSVRSSVPAELLLGDPALRSDPTLRRNAISGDFILDIVPSGAPPLTIEWFEGAAGDRSRPVAGASAPNLAPPPSLQERRYWVRISNAFGSVSSAATPLPATPMLLTGPPRPWITRAGSPGLFSLRVAFARPPGPIAVQIWRGTTDVTSRFHERARRRLTGVVDGLATSEIEIVLEVESVLAADVGDLVFEVASEAPGPASVRSAAVGLRLAGGSEVPYIVTQPSSRRVAPGADTRLAVQVSPALGCTFQWRRDGFPVPGATTSSLDLPAVSERTAGRYDVIVSLPTGQVLSESAVVEIEQPRPPEVTRFPSGLRHVAEGAAVTLEAVVAGSGPLSYQWFRDGIALPGASGPALELTRFSAGMAGDYAVVVSGPAGSSAPVAPARLRLANPVFLRAPVRTYPGDSGVVVLSVEASGAPPLAFQWFEGSPPDRSRPVPGGRAPEVGLPLALTPRTFWAEASNASGTALSDPLLVPAERMVLASPPEGWATLRGGRAVFSFRVAFPAAPDGVRVRILKGAEDVTARFAEVARQVRPASREGLATTEVEFVFEVGALGSSDEGDYVFEISTTSPAAAVLRTRPVSLRLAPPELGLTALVLPRAQRVGIGATVQLRVEVTPLSDVRIGSAAPLRVEVAPLSGVTYQWRRNGLPIPGATGATLVLTAAGVGDTGLYDVLVRRAGAAVVSEGALVEVEEPASRITNFSARVMVEAIRPVIVGVGIGGREEQRLPLLIRGVGPSLLAFGVPNPVSNPELLILDSSGERIGGNDDWITDLSVARVFARVGAFPFAASAGRDAATLASSRPGTFTVHLASRSGGAGVALAEIYDASETPADGLADTARLLNLSLRTTRGPGADVVVGLVVRGSRPLRVLARAVGPGLRAFGFVETMADPRLTLYRSGGNLLENDDWGRPGGSAITEASLRVGAFALAGGSRDAALVAEIPPGSASLVLGGDTGEVLLEVYVID